MQEQENDLYLQNLIEKTKALDPDILIVQDASNTKKISFLNLKVSMIEDNDIPTNYRMYSSKKMQDTIDQLSNTISTGVGIVQEDIHQLQNESATHTEVSTAIEGLDIKKVNYPDLDPLNQAIGERRLKTEPIKSVDLDTSSEESKLHIKHLGADIISAMTGSTPVTAPSVPAGGWVTDNIANKAITSTKIASNYRYKGHFLEGHVNDFLEDGLYTLSNNITGLPKYEVGEEQTRLLHVERFGKDIEYIKQTIYYIATDKSRPTYKRQSTLTRIHASEFVGEYQITDNFKVNNSLMGDTFSNRGIINTGNIYDIRKEGTYYIKAGVKNMPTSTEDYIVRLSIFDTKYEYIAKAITSTKCEIYESVLYYDSNHSLETTQWFILNTMNKSKFDGKSFHLYGDGVVFGVGSSDIPSKSFASILTNKYGFRVFNHSIGDATIGNYDDEMCKERSVIHQIDNTSFTIADYVIIFAGSEDFKTGKGVIGKNTDNIDTTFKGSINIAISKILSKNNNTKILLVTPLSRYRLNAGDGKDCDITSVNDKYLSQFAEAIKEIGIYNHIPVLDIFNTCMINKYNQTTYLKDGFYPNDTGHQLIAEKIFDGMNTYY